MKEYCKLPAEYDVKRHGKCEAEQYYGEDAQREGGDEHEECNRRDLEVV